MPDSRPLPAALYERLKATYSKAGFRSWPAYEQVRASENDPLLWLGRTAPLEHADVFDAVHAAFSRPYARLGHTTCQSNAAFVFLQALLGAGVDPKAFIEEHEVVPLCMVGHLLLTVHCDPSARLPAAFPEHLVGLVWTAVDDYLDVRDDFIERAEALLDGLAAMDLRKYAAPPPGQTLRAQLAWVATLPTIEENERAAMQALAALPDADLTPSRLSSEQACALSTVGHPRVEVVPASYLSVDKKAFEFSKAHKRFAELQFLPYGRTPRHILIATGMDQSPALLDELARSFAGLRPIITRGPADGIRQHLADSARAAAGPTVSSGQEDDLRGVQWRIDHMKYKGRSATEFRGQIDELIMFLLADATSRRTSDIHIDVFAGMTRVRYVIDGDAQFAWSLGFGIAQQIATKLRLEVTKRGKDTESAAAPQEGSFTYAFMGNRVMCRLVIVYHDENPVTPKIVLRILDMAQGVRDLTQLGFLGDELALLKRHITRRNGIVIVSGPTGHGKSTTLTACLRFINDPRKILYTLEDPIEWRIPGVTQLPAASKQSERTSSRLAMGEGIRLLLRGDPDVLMVGELRDLESANSAIEFANTGHLLFATTHANSAVDIVKRAVHWGVDRAELGDTLRLLVSQRLVKKLCTCKRPVAVSDDIKKLLEDAHIPCGKRVYEPNEHGCPRCAGRGYFGRSVVCEMLDVTEELRDMIADGRPIAEIRATALRTPGFVPIFTAGLRRVASGHTSFAALADAIDSR